MEIRVLGPGCKNCEAAMKNVMDAVAEAGVKADIDKVTNALEIAKYGVFGTPAVVMNGEAKSVSRIPSKEEIKDWLKK